MSSRGLAKVKKMKHRAEYDSPLFSSLPPSLSLALFSFLGQQCQSGSDRREAQECSGWETLEPGADVDNR